MLNEKLITEVCIYTTETPATRSYIIIPASARARLAQDTTTGRSPANQNDKLLNNSQENHIPIKFVNDLSNKRTGLITL